jgi:hypothetical protein
MRIISTINKTSEGPLLSKENAIKFPATSILPNYTCFREMIESPRILCESPKPWRLRRYFYYSNWSGIKEFAINSVARGAKSVYWLTRMRGDDKKVVFTFASGRERPEDTRRSCPATRLVKALDWINIRWQN